ncbi:MAG: B12-binding domain-containing radical SAM protein [Planctomycetes bacterium]|nr:B12-binding domain-containing radical SAM protein [Planctomycetota bacterium]
MNIKLISPRMTLRPMDSEFKRMLSPSLSLVIVASLTPPEHPVTISDENLAPLNFNDTPDLVGINVNVDTSQNAYQIAARYRQKGVPVILGGIHASANPEEALRHADAVCIGEAECVWQAIIEDVLRKRLKPRYQNPNPTDLSLVPLPRWDAVHTRQYLYTNIVSAGRGCPFKCDFCYNSSDYVKEHRNRPVSQVIEEIKRMNTRQVMFIDDNFIGNPTWTQDLLAAMAPMNLTWHAAVSANLVHHIDLLDQMANAGCHSLFIGFESINAASLQGGNKSQNQVKAYERLIREIHARRIMVNASLVFGMDQDTPEVFDHTLKWLVQNKVETMTAHILTPYPGTRLFNRLKAQGRITDHDWSHYNTSNVVFEPRHMTPTQLRDGYLKLYKDFYSLKNIVRRLPDQKHQRMPYLLFNLGYRKYGKVAGWIVSQLGLMNLYGRVARHLSYGI